ncbi:MAG: GntR family transcriptional regulator [Clostridiales bacterium]|nr:GntR family transcriptional regulator [Clostridiales bacterium]
MQDASEKNTIDLRHLTQEKNLTYVRVYEQLLKMMLNGTFPGDSWLPSEPKLAAQLGVSRMTLRQALELLQEDGLIQKYHGKGNYVIRQGAKPHRSLDYLGHPVYQCCDVTIDHVETEFRIEVPNEQNNELFQRESAVMIAVDRWYRSSGTIVAYTLTLVPVEALAPLDIKLNQPATILPTLESAVYTRADHSRISVTSTSVGNFISGKYVMSPSKEVMLIREDIFLPDDTAPAVCNKHYIQREHCHIEIHPRKAAAEGE